MASLNRPNSVTIWDDDAEETISIGVRVDMDSNTPIFAVVIMDELGDKSVNEYAMSINQTLSLILDLTTAVQAAVVNQR